MCVYPLVVIIFPVSDVRALSSFLWQKNTLFLLLSLESYFHVIYDIFKYSLPVIYDVFHLLNTLKVDFPISCLPGRLRMWFVPIIIISKFLSKEIV